MSIILSIIIVLFFVKSSPIFMVGCLLCIFGLPFIGVVVIIVSLIKGKES